MDEKERELFYFGSYITTNLILSDNTNIPVKFNKIYSTINIAVPSITFNNTINANSIVLGEITNISNLPDKDFTKDIIVNNNPSVIKIKKSIFFGKLSLELIQYSGTNWASGNLVIQPFTLTYNSTTTTNLDSNYVIPYCYDNNIQFNQIGADIDGEAASDYSGVSVSLSSNGSIVAIGAVSNDNETGSDIGHVRVYHWNGTAWVQVGADIDGEAAGDRSGYSVSLSSNGNIVAIGARANNGTGAFSGHVRVYHWNGTAWVQRGSDIDGEEGGDQSGHSVSLSDDGSIVAIGATFNDGNGSDSGHVRVYHWNGTSWVQRGSDIDGEAAGDLSGYSVSLSGDGSIVAISARDNNGTGAFSGHVRVYHWNGTAWDQRGTDIDGEVAYDQSGYSVSLSSDGYIVAISSIYNDGNGSDSGHVRVYHWNGTSWVQRGADIDGEAAGDLSGHSVSLSSDGSIVAIGARENDNETGYDIGHVRVYHWNGTAWVQVGADIDGEAGSDWSGYSVSLNSDGSIVAIGARDNDGNGSESGHVRVYTMPSC